MKNLFITSEGNVSFDTETQECNPCGSDISNVRRVFLIDEPTHVVYKFGDKTSDVYAEPDDIIVVFYNNDAFKNQMVLAKSAKWVDNIRSYRAAEQKRKEEWAAKNAECDGTLTQCDQSSVTDLI